jgi:hypothetical protein
MPLSFGSTDVARAIALLGVVSPRSNKPPPNNSTSSSVRQIAALRAVDQETDAGAFWSLLEAMAREDRGTARAAFYLLLAPQQPRLNPRRPRGPALTPQQDLELKRLVQSADVATLVATAPFWQVTRVSAAAWLDAVGVSGGEIQLDLASLGARAAWSWTLPAVSATEYRAAASQVPARQEGSDLADPMTQLRLMAAADYPHLLLADALGITDQPDAYPYTCQLLDIAAAVSAVTVHRVKHLIQAPRPGSLVAGVAVNDHVIPLPGYSAYPGGHAMFCGLLSNLLPSLTGCEPAQALDLRRRAIQIAEDREIAGLHSAIDTHAGHEAGLSLGDWLVEVAAEGAALPSWAAVFAAASAEWV